jgi:hypothetical protein
MPKVKLPHNGKEYTVPQKDLDIWDKSGLSYKVLEKDVIEKPAILKEKKVEAKEQD